MRFAHIADTHLGFRQYGLLERENDFYSVFDQAVEKIIGEKPDFVVHSGDLFDKSQPPTKALLVVQNALMRLKEHGIVVYAVPGNHDTVMKRNVLPPHVLYSRLGLRVIGRKKPWYDHEGVFIGGIPYHSKFYHNRLKEQLGALSEAAAGYSKRVLVLHQALETYLPFGYELQVSDLPESFDYYALGHIHKRIIDDFGRGRLAYAGSTEIWSADEVAGYRKKGKGFYMVDLDGDLPEVTPIDLELPREIIRETITEEEVPAATETLLERITALAEKPVLDLHITDVGGSTASLHDLLQQTFGEDVLALRPRYSMKDEDVGDRITRGGSFDPRVLIPEFCGNDPDLAHLASGLYDALIRNDMERARECASDAYGRQP